MNNENQQPGVVVIAGAAPGFGASIARAFSNDGHPVVGLSRRAETGDKIKAELGGARYRHETCDLSHREDLTAAINAIAETEGAPQILIYNAMKLVPKPFLELTPQDFEESWRATCFGAMNAAQAVLPSMLEAGRGVILFTGATAAIKGNPRFAAFASAKFALRGLAQSLAREFGPQGIHVVHTILDGIIWGPQSQDRFAVKQENCLDPDAVAQAYLDLTRQAQSAWTHEIDMRPFDEKF